MPGFINPLWLIALGLIPLIRWLHRWQSPLSSWPVSALFLWKNPTADQQAGKEKRPPEPAWRRRALAAAFMITALSGPYLQSESRSLTVWIDDSLSLGTIENGSTRLETLFARLASALEEHDPAWEEITLRSLTNPGRAQHYSAGDFGAIDPDDWQAGRSAEPANLTIPFLTAQSSHWLLTDGATQDVHTWAQQASLQRVIQAGVQTENSALTKLAVRRGLGEADRLDVLVAIHNAGLDADTRQLEIRDGQKLLQTTDVSLKAGETFYWQAQLAVSGKSISAFLQPSDYLDHDDMLTVDLGQLEPVSTHVDETCGPALMRALSTHPRLKIENSATMASLLVTCQPNFIMNEAQPIAQIRVVTAPTERIAEAPTWFSYEGVFQHLSLPGEWLSAATWPDDITFSETKIILRAGDQPLVALHDRGNSLPLIVYTVIDMGHPLFIAQAEYAAFVATLVDLASGRLLLDEVISSSRDPLQSNIRPTPVNAKLMRSTPVQQATAKPLSSVFIIAALLLLALDAALLVRAREVAASA